MSTKRNAATEGEQAGVTRRATVTRLRPKARRRPVEPAAQGVRPSAVEPEYLRDSYGSTAFAEVIDRTLHAAIARFTAGLAPMTLIGAYADWAAHLAAAPGKQMLLAEKAAHKWLRLANCAARRAAAKDGAPAC